MKLKNFKSLFFLQVFLYVSILFGNSYHSKPNFINDNKSIDGLINLNLDTLHVIECEEVFPQGVNKRINPLLYQNKFLFFYDSRSCKVYRYNFQTRKFINFCRKGQGPGEVGYIASMSFQKDSLCLIDFGNRRIAKFNLEGKFIRNEKFSEDHAPCAIKSSNNGCYLSNIITMNTTFSNGKLQTKSQYKFELFNGKLEYFNTVFQSRTIVDPELKYDSQATFGLGAICDNFIVINNQSKNKYELDIYNFFGEKISTIRKKYLKQKYSKNEQKQNKKEAKNMGYNIVELYKNSIDNLMIDKFYNIWVETPNKNSSQIDIFHNGKYCGVVNKTNYLLVKDKLLIVTNDNKLILCNYEYKINEK